ncbi:hypothetical protein, partial [Porphyromonas loveana]|uniref:hypothetical protein n=1 Tax=Porphyromonas loveana TaxID=1884669 RepID=UPI0035A02CCE
ETLKFPAKFSSFFPNSQSFACCAHFLLVVYGRKPRKGLETAPLMNKEQKKHFSVEKLRTKRRKIVFQPKNRRQRLKKRFFGSLSTIFCTKNHFSALCRRVTTEKTIF